MSIQTLDELQYQYRSLETAYGNLETMVRMNDELMQLRWTGVQSRLLTVQGPLFVAIAATFGGLPTLYSCMPADWQNSAWPWVLGVLLGAFTLKLTMDTIGAWIASRKLKKMLPSDQLTRLELQAWFVQLLISSYGARLALARRILALPNLSAPQAEKFKRRVDWWVLLIQEQLNAAQSDENIGHFSDKEREQIREWAAAALADD